MKLSKAEADARIKGMGLSFGKYAILKYHNSGKYTPLIFACATHGYLYSHVYTALAHGIKNQGLIEPRSSNGYCHCAIIDVETGEICWRNYED